ncbi:hypothetical protein D3C87_1786590 [compost metagenome]
MSFHGSELGGLEDCHFLCGIVTHQRLNNGGHGSKSESNLHGHEMQIAGFSL